jgi:RNA polymerase sigma factor (sigma-70 family)
MLGRLADDLDAGFVQLVQNYGPVLQSVALRVTGHPVDAEDLTAETFLRAYRALRDYSPERIAALRPRAWLMTILLNVWRNTVRERQRRPVLVLAAGQGDEAATGPSIEELVERKDDAQQLAQLVTELPAAQRAAVVLRHVVGLPVAEIAVVMDCPEGTVKSHVSRGLARLRAGWAPAPAVSAVAGPDLEEGR